MHIGANFGTHDSTSTQIAPLPLKLLPLPDSTAKLWCLVNFENRHLGHPQYVFGPKLMAGYSYVLYLFLRPSFGILETFWNKLGNLPKNSQNNDF